MINFDDFVSTEYDKDAVIGKVDDRAAKLDRARAQREQLHNEPEPYEAMAFLVCTMYFFPIVF